MLEALRRRGWRTEPWLILIIAVMAIGIASASPQFLTLRNLLDLVDAYAVTAIFACGLLVVIVFGGIDISFAGIAAVAQYLTAIVMVSIGGGWPTALLCSAVLGLVLGLWNAVLIHGLRLLAVIVTISNMSIYFGLLIYVTRGRSIYELPPWFGQDGTLLRWQAAGGQELVVTVAHLGFVLVFGATWLLLTRLNVGRQIVAHGGNPDAAKRAGCNILGLHCLAYGYMGLLAGLGGLVQAFRVQEVVPNALIGRELDVLAAVVLGGASLLGGIGTVLGTLLGIILLAVLKNGLLLLGVSSYAMNSVTGLVILLSVSATALADKLRARRTLGHAA